MTSSEKQKIVITGFGPFEGYPVNSSWESVKLIPDLWKHDLVDVIIDEVPVCYDYVKSNICNKWADQVHHFKNLKL